MCINQFKDERQYIIYYGAAGTQTVHWKHREKCRQEQHVIVPT